MKIGDLVIVRRTRYIPGGDWVPEEHLGVITSDSGALDGTGEYKVYAVNGRHSWYHTDELRFAN